MTLISLSTQAPAHPLEDQSGPALLSVGFRPFFFLAALLAGAFLPLWLLMLQGLQVRAHFSGVTLHAHEMLFGFGSAVIVGFLLTAGANWTGRRTTNAKSLALLSALWLAGRFSTFFATPAGLGCLADVLFLPTAGAVLAVALIQSKSRRNYQFLFMLAALSLANVLMHVGAHGISFSYRLGQELALRVITLMILVMGGRVIFMFTKNATGGSGMQRRPRLERAAQISFLLGATFQLFAPVAWAPLGAALLMGSGALYLVAMSTWGFRQARVPLLWILHFGYFATATSLVLEGLAGFSLLPPSLALHLFTVGGMGGLCLGMMTRVSLGHSGRMLTAPPSMNFAFILLVVATVTRLLGSLAGSYSLSLYVLSGLSFSAAFLLLLFFGVPIWFSPRVDLHHGRRP